MDIKVYFKTNTVFLTIAWIFCVVVLSIMSYFLLFVGKEVGPSIFIIVVDILIIFSFICVNSYGFRIKNNKISIISQYRVRFCKLENVEKLDIEFEYDGKYYDCYATLYLTNGKISKFVWTKIHSSKGPDIEFKITENDVYEYKNKLMECDKINVEIR